MSAGLELAVLVLIATGLSASAQSRRFELSSQFAFLDVGERAPGVGATLTYNVTRRFGLESTLNFFPGDTRNNFGSNIKPVLGAWRSGNILQGQFGLRATVVHLKRAAFFLKVKPGFTSFSHLAYHAPLPFALPNAPEQILIDGGRQTCPSLDVGGGAAFLPSRSTFLRFDIGETIVRYNAFASAFNLGPDFGIQPLIRIREATAHTLQFSMGIGLRFGGSK
jgi:hypothetical protein